MTTASTVTNDGLWVELPAEEWQRRLEQARAQAMDVLATAGLDTDTDEKSPAALICEGALGPSLRPNLDIDRQHLRHLIELAMRRGPEFRDFEEALVQYEGAVAEAAYRFGVIAGCHVSWPMVAAMPAPYAPPPAPRPKGGAR
jgi:hypothetical protein